jgi:hypothetical protein
MVKTAIQENCRYRTAWVGFKPDSYHARMKFFWFFCGCRFTRWRKTVLILSRLARQSYTYRQKGLCGDNPRLWRRH